MTHHRVSEGNLKEKIDSGICIHGAGEFGQAMLSILLDKFKRQTGEITVISRGKTEEILNNFEKQAQNILVKENVPFSVALGEIGEKKKTNSSLVLNSKIKILSEEENMEEYLDAVASSDYHLLALPSEAIQDRIELISLLSRNIRKLIILDLAKGDHEISNSPNVVYGYGPNFASEIRTGQPTGINIAGGNEEKVNRIVKLLSSSKFRPVIHQNPEAIKKGGMWKNVMALGAGFLTQGKSVSEKATITALLFRKILEWAKKEGFSYDDMISLAGIGDYYMCMDPKSRNYLAGDSMHEDLQPAGEDLKAFFEALRKNVAQKRGQTDVTIEGINAVQKMLDSNEYTDDVLLKMFLDIPKNMTKENGMNDLRDLTIADLLHNVIGLPKSEVVNKRLSLIKNQTIFIKYLTEQSGYKKNTDALIMSFGMREVLHSFKDKKLALNDYYEIIKEVFGVAFAESQIDEEKFKESAKYLKRINLDSNIKKQRPLLWELINFAKKVDEGRSIENVKEIVDMLMKKPIQLNNLEASPV